MIKPPALLTLPACALALSACQSLSSCPPAAQMISPSLPPPPAEAMQPREPTFRARLLQILSSSPAKQTTWSASSSSSSAP